MTEQEQILTALLDCKRVDLYKEDIVLSEQQSDDFTEMKIRRSNGEPLQYILGFTEFMGLRMNVNPHVLIPRPETEFLVEKAVEALKGNERPRVLDLCTGSGNIAIALAKLCSEAHVTALDISQDALTVARQNAENHDVADRVDFQQENVLNLLSHPQKFTLQFDVVISNPPYISDNELAGLPMDVRQEPSLALAGGQDGADFYRVIVPFARRVLKTGGFLFCEMGETQSELLLDIVQKTGGFCGSTILDDLTDRPRILKAELR